MDSMSPSGGQGRRGSSGGPPIGLLSPANADLYRRFEVEEAKTNHLRAKEQQQSDALSQLTARLEDINQSLVDEEANCGKRTAQIKEELDRLDREEAALDVQMKQRKKVLQTMTSAVADIKVQLAYNFTTLPKSRPLSAHLGGGAVRCAAEPMFDVAQFAETLTDSEVADIVGESYYVDESGARHRVVFSEPSDDAVAGGGGDSNTSSPQRASSSTRKGGVVRSKRGGGNDRGTPSAARGSWLNSTVAKRATYLLLSSARQEASDRLQDVENRGDRGEYAIDAEYFADLAAAKAQLAAIHKATRSLLLTTPTSASLNSGFASDPASLNGSSLATSSSNPQEVHTPLVSSPSRRSGGVTVRAPATQHMTEEQVEAHHSAVMAALPIQPVLAPEFQVALARQREQLAQLRFLLQQDEALMEGRKGMEPKAWVAAVQATDNEQFQSTRVVMEPTVLPQPPLPSRHNPSPNFVAASATPTATTPSVRTTGRSDAAPRPTSAPSMSRFAAAATRSYQTHHTSALPRARMYEERYLQASVPLVAAPRGGAPQQLQPHAPEYKFRSHQGLYQAVEHRGEAAKRERLRQRRQFDDAGDDAASSRHHTE